MNKTTISKSQTRRLILGAAGLHKPSPFGRGLKATKRAIDQLGYVQVDTISVLQRAHHHILNTRNPTYQPKHLDQLQRKTRDIFEYWAHAAAYLPMQSYRFALPMMHFFRSHQDRWPKADPKVKESVLDRITHDGPMKSRDFDSGTLRKTGWWDWGSAKVALQRLFFEGSLMISYREGFQRVYDIPERILPEGISTTCPTDEELAEHLVMSAIQGKGLIRAKDAYYLRGQYASIVKNWIKGALSSGQIIAVSVERHPEIFYSTLDMLEHIPTRIAKNVRLLSPFDNVVIQRDRVQQFFNFHYQIECYVPKSKRKVGYYSLPILYGTDFVGQMDCKADRKTGTLLIHNFVWSGKSSPTAAFYESMYSALEDLNKRNDCQSWKLSPRSVDKFPDAEYIA